MLFKTIFTKVIQQAQPTSSAMGNDHHTKLTTPESERRYAVGIKTTSCLATLTIRLYILLPSAWQVEMLTIDVISEIQNLFIVDVQHQQKEKPKDKKQDSENDQQEEKEIPLHFELFDYTGNYIKMFSRTCKIKKSKELYDYFKNNDAVKMKIN